MIKDMKRHKLGKVKFHKHFQPSQIQKHLTQLMDWTIFQNIWKLGYQQYVDNQGPQIFKMMKSVFPKALHLDRNLHLTIIQQIKHISFPDLEVLLLDRNFIESIESLPIIDLPKLRVISIRQNRLTNILSLRKCIIRDLKEIDLHMNNIIDIQSFSEANYSNLSQFTMEYNWEYPQTQNIYSIVKLETRILSNNKLTVSSRHRVQQEKLKRMCQKRFT